VGALVVGATMATGLLVAWPWLRRQKALAQVGVALVILLVIGVGFLTGVSMLVSSGSASRSAYPSSAPMARDKMAVLATEQTPAEDEATPDYAGLPARIHIPSGERDVSFGGTMLGAEAARRVRVVALSAGIVDSGITVLALGALVLLVVRRRDLQAGIARRLELARGSRCDPQPSI
jgi:hypothetical protein